MNTKIAFIAAGIALSFSALAADPVEGGNKVTFNGEVTNISCTVTIDGKSDSTVTLDPVGVGAIKSAGNDVIHAQKPFVVNLSNCTPATDANKDTLGLKWSSGYLLSGSTKGYLANTLADGAKNVQLVLLTGYNGKTILPGYNGQETVAGVAGPSGTEGVNFTYHAGYVSNNAAEATAGKVSTWATYEINYN